MLQKWRALFGRANPLGEGLRAGDRHHRAYVGPPADYDLVAAMVFNLLTCLGLRQHHRLLDIGCGSLRVGRLLIPYLNAGNYLGLEPNRWLVSEGVRSEIGRDAVRIKRPRFFYADSLGRASGPLRVDFALAQSIFSHTGTDLLDRWLRECAFHLKSDGALFATFLIGEEDFSGGGWVYPGCVHYTPETMALLAAHHGLRFRLLDWRHPRQSWAIFYGPEYDTTLIDAGSISWNRLLSSAQCERPE